ncbi:hypothetical protein L1987_00868 [Smallanthus sonchifolius]|uniref:Uncharacterized protein n=1 Tax=Smallanthus sonchifolius TaxID=185202 RepID=A0ACB9K3I2_9ASTR|nr:hypothetical protein L1987_00868 [Smallanthus sonchifolius]
MVVLTEIPGRSSSSTYDYDVFLSFRGTDTRSNFTDHLLKALLEANIETFFDDTEIQIGEFLKPELESAIKSSRASIIVLSKDYASSTWRETILIEGIVKEMSSRLDIHKRSEIPKLIGMKSSVMTITSFLKDVSGQSTEFLTIWGMAGIGKTYLANYVFKLHYRDFERSCFLEDIERRCTPPNGLLDLQKQLLKDIRVRSWMDIIDVDAGTLKIEKSLLKKRTLVVLDGINKFEQLDVLIGTKGLHPGSKIIITSKNGSLTEKCRLFETQVPPKHTKHLLEGLNDKESLQLLSWHAFGRNEPNEGDKKESIKVVNYCNGHPLALKVLGGSLRSEDSTWDDILVSLGKEINPDITEVLKLSFDTLPSEKDKELFKHIACLFVGEDRKFTEDILKECGICKSSGMKVLINRCLLTVGSYDQLMMHQLLQDMGRDIVRQESPKKPWKRSILWHHEECLDVLQNSQGTTIIQGLVLDMRTFENKTSKEPSSANMQKFGFGSLPSFNWVSGMLEMKGMESLKVLMADKINMKSHGSSSSTMEATIETFFDDTEIQIGEFLKPELESAIKSSRASIIVLSKDYASSTWRETILIEGIVKEISGRLDLHKRKFLTIWGMAGIGKTYLADYIFKSHYFEFDGSCFLEDIERRCTPPNGLLDLQKQLLKDIGARSWMDINDVNAGTFKIGNSLFRKRTLLVLDGIDKFEQLDVLIGTKGLHPRSKIIITFKNGSLTERCRLFKTQVQPKHMEHLLHGLNNKESLELLSWHAFGRDEPNEGEEEESMKVVKYCNGHPPALKVLGCSLRSEDATWEDILESLGKEINRDIKNVLKVSFDALPSEKDKELFKHIACLFVGEDRKFTEDILKACGVCKTSGIKILINRCLLTVDSSDKLRMHQLLQEMGRDIVRQESPKKPWKRTILWYHEECLDVLQNRQDMEALKVLSADNLNIKSLESSSAIIQGINVCIVRTISSKMNVGPSRIEIANLTKNSYRTYQPIMYVLPKDDDLKYGNEVVVWLSHWMFEKNEFEDGDDVSIHFGVKFKDGYDGIGLSYDVEGEDHANVREYGISLVYDDGGNQKEDPLGYYKSWKHIIGGHLSAIEDTSSDYLLKPRLTVPY